MSFKSIEMQVALPRTKDAGRIQEQLNQRSMINQSQESVEQKNKTEAERHKPLKMNGSEQRTISSQDENSKNSNNGSGKRRQKEEENEKNSPHPYKGKHIDISL